MSYTRHLSARACACVSLLFKPFACLAAILAAMLPFALQASAAVTFTASEIASRKGISNSIISGDFNNDGILDLVTSDEGADGYYLSFYKGLGEGKYAAPVSTKIVYPLGQLVAADFNGDGKLDIAGVVYLGSNVMVFLGNGHGTFTQGATLPGENESIATSIVAICYVRFTSKPVKLIES